MTKASKLIDIMPYIFLGTLLFLGAVFYSSAVKASTFDLNDVPELTQFELLPEEEFKTKTRHVEFSYKEDPAISHSFQLPKDWSDNKAYKDIDANRKVSNRKVLSIIARYNSPPNKKYAPSYFTVEAMELEYEIGIRNWFVNYVLANGLSLQGMSVEDDGKRKLEAVYVEVQKDTTYVVRTKALINGAKIIVARYYVPLDLFEKNKIFQAQVLHSFQLKNADNSPIEKLETHGFLNQAYFDYPPSWTLNATQVSSIDVMKAMLHRNSILKKLDGQVNVKLYSKITTAERKDVIKKFREEFSIKNYKVGGFIEDLEGEYHSEMTYGSMQAYELAPTLPNMVKYELWVSISESDEYIYLNTLITPSREEEFYAWARNGETFRLIVKSMRGHQEEKSLYQYLN